MRRKVLLMGLTFILLVGLITAASLKPVSTAQADNLLQDVPRLDGYQVYFTEAAGEASRFDRSSVGLSRLAGLIELLGADLYTLEWRNGIPAEADLLVIAGPINDITPEQTAWLWDYLQGGGRLLVLAEPAVAPSKAFKSNAGLFQLMWDDMGLRVRDDVVVTESGEVRPVVPPTPRPKEGQPTPAPGPAEDTPILISNILATSINSLHPTTQGLEIGLNFFGTRSIEVDTTPREVQVTPLVYSDSQYYGEKDFVTYLQTGYVQFNIDTDTTRTNLVLAAAMDNIVNGGRIMLIGDRDFATNGGGLQTSPSYSASFMYPDNVRFLVNTVAWLLDAESIAGEIAFPTPAPTATPTTTPSPTPLPEPTATPTASS
ncbi:MAG: hypothetical protein HY866_03855 [Chloroflexi bacterium]|nr:hypothetical protein [Chloroflexota bacterium]